MNILCTYALLRRFEPQLRARLGPDHDLAWLEADAADDPGRVFPACEVLLTPRFPAAWTRRFPSLRLLHAVGAGLDKIDLAALPPGARVCRTFGHGPSIAEFVLLAMLALSRQLLPADRALRAGRWLNPQYDPDVPLAPLVSDRTVVILGTGEIGAHVAGLCRRLDLRCVGVNRSGRTAENFDEVLPLAQLDAALARADLLVIAVPLDAATRGLLGAPQLRALPLGAVPWWTKPRSTPPCATAISAEPRSTSGRITRRPDRATPHPRPSRFTSWRTCCSPRTSPAPPRRPSATAPKTSPPTSSPSPPAPPCATRCRAP